MRRVKFVAECSLGDLKRHLRALKKRHDSLYEEHQKSHREFMEHGIGGRAERKKLYEENQMLNRQAEEILYAAQEINREIEWRREEALTCC